VETGLPDDEYFVDSDMSVCGKYLNASAHEGATADGCRNFFTITGTQPN